MPFFTNASGFTLSNCEMNDITDNGIVYNDQIRSVVADKVRDARPGQKGTLPLITSAIKEAWEAESDEVKEMVLEAVANQPDLAHGHGTVKKTPKAYAKAIDKLPNILTQFFEELSEMTGWAFEVICGGPDPQNDGRLRTLGFHRGESASGLSFSKAYPGYQENVLTPFNCYIKDVFPIAIRNARALRPEDDMSGSETESDGDDEGGGGSELDGSEEEGPVGWWAGSNMTLPKTMGGADTTLGPEDDITATSLVSQPGSDTSDLPEDDTMAASPASHLPDESEVSGPDETMIPSFTTDSPAEGSSDSPALIHTTSTWPDKSTDPRLRGESHVRPPGDAGVTRTSADRVVQSPATMKEGMQVSPPEAGGPSAGASNVTDQTPTTTAEPPVLEKKRKMTRANDVPEAEVMGGHGKRARKLAGPRG